MISVFMACYSSVTCLINAHQVLSNPCHITFILMISLKFKTNFSEWCFGLPAEISFKIINIVSFDGAMKVAVLSPPSGQHELLQRQHVEFGMFYFKL